MATVIVQALNPDRVTVNVSDTQVQVVVAARTSNAGYERIINSGIALPSNPYNGQKFILIAGATRTWKQYDLATLSWITIGTGGGGSGDFIGPAGAVDENIVVFDGITGKQGKDGGKKISDLALTSDIPTSLSQLSDDAAHRLVTDTEKNTWNGSESASNKDQPNGYAGLTGGKLNISQIPDAVLGQLKYGGTFIANGTITSDITTLNGQDLDTLSASDWKGYYFICQADSTHFTIDFLTGDWCLSNGSAGWTKVDNTDAVMSVNGQIGSVTLNTDDINETGTPTNLWFTEARVRSSLLTGLVTGLRVAIVESDSILTAFGKVVKWLSDLGDAAFKNTGTIAGTVCAGDDSRLSDNRTDANALHKNIVNEVNALNDKTVLADADVFLIEDSEIAAPNTFQKLKVTFANLKASLKSYFDTLYASKEIILVPTSDPATTSDAASDITGMGGAVVANTRYYITGVIKVTMGNVTGGFKLAINLPAGATLGVTLQGASSGGTVFLTQNIAAIDTLTSLAFGTTNNAVRGIFINGTISIAGTAGTCQMRFASGTNGQTTTVNNEGSCVKLKKIS